MEFQNEVLSLLTEMAANHTITIRTVEIPAFEPDDCRRDLVIEKRLGERVAGVAVRLDDPNDSGTESELLGRLYQLRGMDPKGSARSEADLRGL